MIGMGEIFSLACALMWASAVVLYKYAGDSMSANTLNLVKNVLGLVLLIPTALLIEGLNVPNLTLFSWFVVVISGYIGIAVADTLYLLSLRIIGASRTAIVGSLYSPFVVLFSMIFLHEKLATSQWFGFILVISGIFVVVYQRHATHISTERLIKGAALGALSVCLTAAGVVAMKPILSNPSHGNSFFWLVTLRMLAGTGGMIIYLAVRRRLVVTYISVKTGPHRWAAICLASLFGSYFALIFWLAGFKYTDASIASVLNETANIFIVLMAAMLLGEPLDRKKVSGVVLTFLGVLIFLGLLRF